MTTAEINYDPVTTAEINYYLFRHFTDDVEGNSPLPWAIPDLSSCCLADIPPHEAFQWAENLIYERTNGVYEVAAWTPSTSCHEDGDPAWYRPTLYRLTHTVIIYTLAPHAPEYILEYKDLTIIRKIKEAHRKRRNLSTGELVIPARRDSGGCIRGEITISPEHIVSIEHSSRRSDNPR